MSLLARSLNKILLLTALNSFVVGCDNQIKGSAGSSSDASLAACSNDTVTTGACKVEAAGVAVTDNLADILATNIVNGITIFGVTGTAVGPYSACTDDALNAGLCSTAANRYVTATNGADVNGAAGSLTAAIPTGYYSGRQCTMSDADLIAGNIKTGVNIFGIAGSLTEAYAACTDEALNAGQCSTATNRYVTSASGNNITGWANGSATTTVSAAIPNAYYNGKNVQFTDADLLAANILSGIDIFGVAGTATAAYTPCTDDALNAGQCSTATNRYVYASANGGRSANCSLGLNAAACWTNATNQYMANAASTDVTLTTGTSATIPFGYTDGAKVCSVSDADLTATKIKSGVDILGVAGTFTGTFDLNMASGALRDPGSVVNPYITTQAISSQISLSSENATYAGVDLPTTGGYNYRDIPDQAIDDEGYLGTNCKYAPRPSNDCGTAQATITDRINHCATQNPTTSTWDGASLCNRGQGTWTLVVRDGANKEVWRDNRTGLLWSSLASTSINWCQASGNTQNAPVSFKAAYNNAAGTPITGNGTVGSITGGSSSADEDITITFTSATTFTVSGANCGGGAITAGGLTASAGSTVTWSRANFCSITITQGATNFANNDKFVVDSDSAASYSCAAGAASALQPASPISFCAEAAGLNAPAGENWGTGTYMAAKGRLGKNATPSVRWRLPSIEDYNVANANGIRFVMPDMGIAGAQRPTIDASTGSSNYEWSASVVSVFRYYSWMFGGGGGSVSNSGLRDSNDTARCVGR